MKECTQTSLTPSSHACRDIFAVLRDDPSSSPKSSEPGRIGVLAIGDMIDRYQLGHKLGAGGMSVVYAAFDPELDRKVALKLLLPQPEGHSGRGEQAQARLLHEAQALAKLAHPNVVAIYDVGTHGDRVWIAIEYVAGNTLREWARLRPRTWSEIARVLTDAARGVAAAHAAGLVHGDLKPDNIMIDSDDRVRVMDFGLARVLDLSMTELELASTPSPPEPKSTAYSTQPGEVHGTPPYISPERWLGEAAGPAADQFAWSVMAWELLYGERPFVGATKKALKEKIVMGQRSAPPRGHRVPNWLRRVVERGLSTDPSMRWPTMAELLTVLERDRSRARVRIISMVFAGSIVLTAGAEGYRRWDIVQEEEIRQRDIAQREAACEASGASVDGMWNGMAHKRVRDAFMATRVSYAATTADKVMPWLDEKAAAWKRARTDVCLNADVRHIWDQPVMDRALWCLEDRQMEMESLVSEFGRANATTLQKAVSAAAGLRTVEACLDEGWLRRQPVPPERERGTLRDVRNVLARAHSIEIAGSFKAALEATMAVRQRLEGKGAWPPLLAAARAQEGSLLEKTGEYQDAETVSKKAYFEAADSGAWEVATEAATKLIFITGDRLAHHVEGLDWAEHTKVAISQAGDPEGLREARRLNNLAVVDLARGAYDEALALHKRALAIVESALGPAHPQVALGLNNIALVYLATGEFGEARRLQERAVATFERALGPDHPAYATSLSDLAKIHLATGAYAEARMLFERAVFIQQSALGPDHVDLATSLGNLANVYMSTGEYVKARMLYERTLGIFQKALGPDHPAVAMGLGNIAQLLEVTGAYGEARRMHDRALAIFKKTFGPEHRYVAQSLSDLADVSTATGALVEARALSANALALREKALGPNHPEVAMSLHGLARVQIAEKKPRDALPLLERAVTIMEAHEGVQDEEFDVHFSLAKVLTSTRGDHGRALREARTAREGFRLAGVGASKNFAEVEDWLAKHEKRSVQRP